MTPQEKLKKEHVSYVGRMRLLWSIGKLDRVKYPSLDALVASLDAELEAKLAKLDTPAPPKPRPQQEFVEPSSDDIWNPPDRPAVLKHFQAKECNRVWHNLFVNNYWADLISSGTGSGKTYMACSIIDRLIRENWHKDFIAPWPYVVVTASSVIEQFTRVAKFAFKLPVDKKVLITSYDQLRSSFGDRFLGEKTEHDKGEPVIKFVWHKWVHPMFVVWDECHKLKNPESQQSKIGQALNDLPGPPYVKQIFMSATAGTRVVDFKCHACACRVGVDELQYD